ncbi:hypothetical protein ACPF64_04750 [Acinetobacter sp. KB005]|uniref:hypothetical protein n=1 Tax=Acinetobacter sp. KB005 TaxID=3416667 RepID=UPI003CF7A0F7
MYKYFLIILSILFSGCNPFSKNEKENFKDMTLKNLTYSHMYGMSGDIFKFNLETDNELNNISQENNYKYSHFKCDNIKNYLVVGAISVKDEKLVNGKYTSHGYFKVCKDESMNVCINKSQLEKILSNDMSCRVVFGGFLKGDKVIADDILISKEAIRKSYFK